MTDVEIVLRFFAFHRVEKISGSVRAMLDNTMKRNKEMPEDEIEVQRKYFTDALSLSGFVLGDQVFRLPSEGRKKAKLSRPLFDAQMITFHTLKDQKNIIRENKDRVAAAILNLVKPESESYELMVGRANTAAAIRDRIKAVEDAVNGVI